MVLAEQLQDRVRAKWGCKASPHSCGNGCCPHPLGCEHTDSYCGGACLMLRSCGCRMASPGAGHSGVLHCTSAGSNLGGLAQPLIMCYTEKSRSKQQNSMEMTRVTDVLTLHLLI